MSNATDLENHRLFLSPRKFRRLVAYNLAAALLLSVAFLVLLRWDFSLPLISTLLTLTVAGALGATL